ncbi:MAG TPA: TIGR02281 family clan AA aspartic protease [Methylocystis sp.]|nr:TIGR02281 family clan AA aspartic protease [Methylocystis sp.]
MIEDALKFVGVAAIGIGLLAQFSDKLPHLSTPARQAPETQIQVRAPAASPAPARPAPRPSTPLDAMFIPAQHGQYFSTAEINGLPIPVMIDTGASFVSLSSEDAAQLGIFPLPGDYSVRLQSANGIVLAAPVKLQRVKLGGIEVYDVDAVVSERGAMRGSLLGMTFLSKLSHVEIASGELVLRR